MAESDHELLELYDREERRDIPAPLSDSRIDRSDKIVRIVGPGFNSVVFSKLGAGDADSVIEEQVRDYQAMGRDFEWKYFSHDEPSDLERRLRDRGFERGDAETLMVLDLSKISGAFEIPSGLEIRSVSDASSLAELGKIQEEIWKSDQTALLRGLSEEIAARPQGCLAYVPYFEGHAASSGWMRWRPERPVFASLWGGSTLPQYRKRGIYRALVQLRAQHAIERGNRYLTVDALPTSRPILEKMGFKAMSETIPYVWKSSNG